MSLPVSGPMFLLGGSLCQGGALRGKVGGAGEVGPLLGGV